MFSSFVLVLGKKQHSFFVHRLYKKVMKKTYDAKHTNSLQLCSRGHLFINHAIFFVCILVFAYHICKNRQNRKKCKIQRKRCFSSLPKHHTQSILYRLASFQTHVSQKHKDTLPKNEKKCDFWVNTACAPYLCSRTKSVYIFWSRHAAAL